MTYACKDIGRPSAGAPPLPIPNREVKPCRADGTGVTPGRVGRRPYPTQARCTAGLFLCPSSNQDVLSIKKDTVTGFEKDHTLGLFVHFYLLHYFICKKKDTNMVAGYQKGGGEN